MCGSRLDLTKLSYKCNIPISFSYFLCASVKFGLMGALEKMLESHKVSQMNSAGGNSKVWAKEKKSSSGEHKFQFKFY